MKSGKYLIKLIDLYKRFASPLLPPACKFYPTCSEYTKEAITKYGAIKGVRLGLFRIIKCHPWQTNQVDLVP